MTGRVTSIVVAPPADIGAAGPKTLASTGAKTRVAISRKILAINARVPSSAAAWAPMEDSLRVVMRTDERE